MPDGRIVDIDGRGTLATRQSSGPKRRTSGGDCLSRYHSLTPRTSSPSRLAAGPGLGRRRPAVRTGRTGVFEDMGRTMRRLCSIVSGQLAGRAPTRVLRVKHSAKAAREAITSWNSSASHCGRGRSHTQAARDFGRLSSPAKSYRRFSIRGDRRQDRPARRSRSMDAKWSCKKGNFESTKNSSGTVRSVPFHARAVLRGSTAAPDGAHDDTVYVRSVDGARSPT